MHKTHKITLILKSMMVNNYYLLKIRLSYVPNKLIKFNTRVDLVNKTSCTNVTNCSTKHAESKTK